MKIFDYKTLINVINNVETREKNERIQKELDIQGKAIQLENSLVSSGILNDWKKLKNICRNSKIRLYPYGSGLDCNNTRFDDNGSLSVCKKSGSYYSDYYGFTVDDNGNIKWIVWHMTSSHFWDGFCNEKEKNLCKINLIEYFIDNYEKYRDFQLSKIEETYQNRIIFEDLIIKEGE